MRWLAVACVAVAWAGVAEAADGVTRVSCRDRGKVVYLAEMAEAAVPAATARALADFPGALCVSLGPEPPPDPAGGMADVISGATEAPPLTTGASGLDAALRVLRGDPVRVAVPAPASAPPVQASPAGVLFSAVNYDALQPRSPDWARLAVYKDADAEVALADWDRIVAADPAAFASLTPDIRVVDGAAMLGAGPVPTGARNGFCLAAAALSLDCRFGQARQADTGEALAMAGLWAPPSASPRADPLDAEADEACPGATVGRLACWASPFALAEADAPPEGLPRAARPTPAEAVPPPARPRQEARRPAARGGPRVAVR